MPNLGLGLKLSSLQASNQGNFDPDAFAYISAIQSADNQTLEDGVKTAINTFVVGCKADGIWSAIKASCILAGARTLSGALVPLAGNAPSNIGFNSGDYSRTLGLKGDGTSKYLNSNRNNNADPQDNKHISVYCTSSNTKDGPRHLIGTGAGPGGSIISSNQTQDFFRINCQNPVIPNTIPLLGLAGASRSSSASFIKRANQNSQVIIFPSTTPNDNPLQVLANPPLTNFGDARISFYSAGESIDLALLESRVASLMSNLLTNICSDATAKVLMTGWVAGPRTLSPIGYAPYGNDTYQYGDEVVRYETGVWIYSNSGLGEIARTYSIASRPWLATWPSGFTAEKICP